MIVRPGEIHMEEDEMNNMIDPSCALENEDKRRNSNRTAMDEQNSNSLSYP